jgi:polysaccharide biosynthesis/export protein
MEDVMRKTLGAVFPALGALLLISAASGTSVAAPSTPETVPAVEGYTLGAGDRLRVTVYNEPNLSGFFSVASDGNLAFPLIGNVQAGRKTPREVETMIHDRLVGGDFVKNAQVSVELTTYRPYYILGEVNRPGQYPYVAGIKLQQAIAAAGGYTYRANRGKAYIQRGDDPAEKAVKIKGPAQPIAPGDTIRIGERYI